MKYKISKEKVKQALITEPLASRNGFFSGVYGDNGTCSVCAVGAVLRTVEKKKFNDLHGFIVTNDICSWAHVEEAYSSNNFLSKLSAEFEYNSSKEPTGSADMRMFLLFLTEAFCPDTLEFEA